MKNLVLSEKKLYRELFLKSQEEFFLYLDNIKNSYDCADCNNCCRIVYLNKTPKEILSVISNGDPKSSLWLNFQEHYVPFGYDSNKKWDVINLDYTLNEQEAKKISCEYVTKVKSWDENSVFYYCRCFKDNKCIKNTCSSEYKLNYPLKVLTLLHDNCAYNSYQSDVAAFIKNDLSKQIYSRLQQIDKYHEDFICNRTGTCCRLSSSEYSHEELLKRAESGDGFAKQFTSIFIPYSDVNDARAIFPEYVDFILGELGENETIHFYHCPHISEDNLCTVYNTDKRPQICADFPNNPLTILYPHCGYAKWKKDVLVMALTSHAMIEIATYTLDKLEQISGFSDYKSQ